MDKSVILTGVRANNELTIGNYFGAILPMVNMAQTKADTYQIKMFIPDLHSFTTPIDHSALYDQIIDTAKYFIASGLPTNDPNIQLYRQSFVSAHSELTWILDCFTGMGELSRMTQFKDKVSNEGEDRLTVGLFNYPVLMAADILLHNATYVPVGDDQSQHLEFTRNLAERFNNKFGDIFTVPVSVVKQHEFFGKESGLRLRDLQDPTKKMSKSNSSSKGTIFLSDNPEEARKKIMSATTDSINVVNYEYDNQPGISNLMEILSLIENKPISEIRKLYVGHSEYGSFKSKVADSMKDFLSNIQANYNNVKTENVIDFLERSEKTVNPIANETLLRVQRAIGLRRA